MNQTFDQDLKVTVSEIYSVGDNSTFYYDYADYNDSELFNEKDAMEDSLLPDMPDILRRYKNFHYSIHGYLTLTVIVLGTIGNIISMVVFTRKSMVTSINIILAALAFADMMVLVTYLTQIKYHTKLAFISHTEVVYPLAVVSMYVHHFFILFHTISVWLTVLVAIWRVMGVCYSLTTQHLRGTGRAKIAVFSTYSACILLCIPEFLRRGIETYEDENGSEKFKLTDSDIYLDNMPLFDFIDDWVFNILLYLIPCIPLTGSTFALIRKLYRAKKKRTKLNVQSNKQDLSSDRLTKILIIILLVFLFVRIPPGVMYVLEYCLGYQIVHQIHFVFAGTINFSILVNSAINFCVYFSMSTQFRTTAHEVFCKNSVKKVQNTFRRRPVQKVENGNVAA